MTETVGDIRDEFEVTRVELQNALHQATEQLTQERAELRSQIAKTVGAANKWFVKARDQLMERLDQLESTAAARGPAGVKPRLAKGEPHGTYESSQPGFVAVDWTFGDGARLHLRANLCDTSSECATPQGRLLHVEGSAPAAGKLASWSAAWWLQEAEAR